MRLLCPKEAGPAGKGGFIQALDDCHPFVSLCPSARCREFRAKTRAPLIEMINLLLIACHQPSHFTKEIRDYYLFLEELIATAICSSQYGRFK